VRHLAVIFFIAVLISIPWATPAQSDLSNQTALSARPHLFAPGIISTPDSEANASFTPDGKTVFFARLNPGWSRITIVLSHRKVDTWTRPEVAGFSGVWKDTDPHVSADGNRLFFASNRPIDGSNTPKKDYDLWFVERTSTGGWGEPKHITGPVNSAANEAAPSTSADGTLYFESSRPTDHAGTHLYRSHLINGEYAAPELLPFSKQSNDANPVVASDDSFIIFLSRDRGGMGGADLFVSFHRADDSWSVPKNLGTPINSGYSESAPGLSPDNHILYFTSDRIDGPIERNHRVNYQELEGELHAIQNGLLNIYEVDIGDIRRLDDGH